VSDGFFQFVADKFIFNVKKDLLYTKNDLWLLAKNGMAQIGVTDFLQRRGGDIVFVELPKEGSKVVQEKEFAQLETIKAVISLKAPIDGTIAGVNAQLAEKPEKINEDPYGEGWLILVADSNLRSVQGKLLRAEQYLELMKSKIQDDLMRSREETRKGV
jgi:glycine cleavage system H protein